MREPLIPFFKYRVLDPVSGAVVIDPLPHPHQSKIEVRAMQPGLTGGSSIGQWLIPLFPPDSEQGKAAIADYSLLAFGQRIEAYLIDSNSAGAPGDPKATGFITQSSNSLTNRSITVADSTWAAQRAITDRSLNFSGTTDVLFTNQLKAYNLVFGDDVATSLASYTNNGTWTTGTDEGLNGFFAGGGGDGLLFTSSYTNANYSNCVIDGLVHLTCGTTAGNTAEGSIIAAVTDANNLVLGSLSITCVTSTNFTVTAEIWTKVAGTYTKQISIPILTGLTSNVLRAQPRLFGFQSGASYTWRLIVNGFDVGCNYTYTATPSGGVGFRSAKTGSSAGETAFATWPYFANAQSLFAQGSITAGSKSINQRLSRVPQLELLNMAANTEGFLWRKNPKAGINNDTMDFAASPGTDLSASVRFEEGGNLVEAEVVGNAMPLATDLEFQGAPGVDNQGAMTWHAITAMRTYGVRSDTYFNSNAADFLGQRSLVQGVAAVRSTPGGSKKLVVLRDAQTADKWRELDKVTVHAPRIGLNNKAVTVLAYTITEGSATQEIIGDQHPWL